MIFLEQTNVLNKNVKNCKKLKYFLFFLAHTHPTHYRELLQRHKNKHVIQTPVDWRPPRRRASSSHIRENSTFMRIERHVDGKQMFDYLMYLQDYCGNQIRTGFSSPMSKYETKKYYPVSRHKSWEWSKR